MAIAVQEAMTGQAGPGRAGRRTYRGGFHPLAAELGGTGMPGAAGAEFWTFVTFGRLQMVADVSSGCWWSGSDDVAFRRIFGLSG